MKDDSTSFKKDDIFRIASMTKAITTVATMQLVEQGKINLNDPVYKYIPAFKNTQVLVDFQASDSTYSTVPLNNAITIKNLLTHTSGIYYGDFETGNLKAIYKKNNMLGLGLSSETLSTKKWLITSLKCLWLFSPGTEWKYGIKIWKF